MGTILPATSTQTPCTSSWLSLHWPGPHRRCPTPSTPPSTCLLKRCWSGCPGSWRQVEAGPSGTPSSSTLIRTPLLIPPMERLPSVVSRSKCTAAPARAPGTTPSPPGVTTTPSPWTLGPTTRLGVSRSRRTAGHPRATMTSPPGGTTTHSPPTSCSITKPHHHQYHNHRLVQPVVANIKTRVVVLNVLVKNICICDKNTKISSNQTCLARLMGIGTGLKK